MGKIKKILLNIWRYRKELLLMFITFVILGYMLEIGSYFLLKIEFPNGPPNLYSGIEFPYISKVQCPSSDIVEWDPYTLQRLIPNISAPNCNINSHGFRGREFNEAKGNNTYRIFIFGGSTVWGIGVTEESYTISAILEKRLNSLNTSYKFEVINVGETGYVSTQELILFHRKILHYNPDLIIVFDGLNDISASQYPMWDIQNNNPKYILRVSNLINLENGITGSIYYYLYKKVQNFKIKLEPKSNLIKLIMYNKRKAQYARHTLNIAGIFAKDGVIRKEAIQYYKSNLVLIGQIARANGIKSLFIFQPTLGYGKKEYSAYEQKSIDMINQTSNWLEIVNIMFPLGEKAVLGLQAEHNFTAYSFVNLFENITKTIYVDSAHYTDEGNMIIADNIFDVLINDKLIPINSN